jgi:hypothetical protein
MSKPRTADQILAALQLRLAGWLPLRLRATYARIVRKPPRAFLILLAFLACGAIAAASGNAASRLLSGLQGAASAAWGIGQYANAVACETGVIAMLLLIGSTVLLADYARLGITYTLRPKIAQRRRLRRLYTWMLICSLGSFAMMPISAAARAVAEDQLRQTLEGSGAATIALNLRATTAGRITADDRNGVWYATPQDGPAALEIKRVLHRGTPSQRAQLRAVLTAVARPDFRHARVPSE